MYNHIFSLSLSISLSLHLSLSPRLSLSLSLSLQEIHRLKFAPKGAFHVSRLTENHHKKIFSFHNYVKVEQILEQKKEKKMMCIIFFLSLLSVSLSQFQEPWLTSLSFFGQCSGWNPSRMANQTDSASINLTNCNFWSENWHEFYCRILQIVRITFTTSRWFIVLWSWEFFSHTLLYFQAITTVSLCSLECTFLPITLPGTALLHEIK